MKIAVLIVFVIASRRSVSGVSSRSPSSVFHYPETRHQFDVCSWQCDNVSAEVSIKTDWELDITTSTSNSILLTIGYNATLKIIGFINPNLHVAVALDGTTGFAGWFNTTSGASIVINIKTGLAKLVYNKDILKINNTEAALGVFSNVITSQIQQLGTHSVTGDEIFDLLAICDAIYNNYSYASIAEVYFKGRKTLEGQIYASFQIWFDLTRNLIATKTVTINFGIVGFFGPIFGRPHTLFVAILKLWMSLYGSTTGQFNSLFTLAIYRILSADIAIDQSDQVFASLTFTTGAIGYFYGNLDSALAGYEGQYRLVSFEKKTVKNVSVVAHGKFVEGSWFVNLKTSSTSTVDVVLLYVKARNVFAIYNRKLNIILVFGGTSGLFAVWNGKTGEGIIVRHSTGAAIVINSDSSIVQSFSADALIHSCITIAAKIDSYKSFGYSLLDKSTFLFGTYLVKAKTYGVASANVAVSSPVRAVIIASFKAFFEQISQIKPSFGVLGVVYVISGGVNIGWSVQIQEFIAAIYFGKLAGRFDSRLFAALYYEISVASDVVGSRKFLGKIIAAVKNITSIDEGVSGAISGVLKTNGIISNSLSGSVFL